MSIPVKATAQGVLIPWGNPLIDVVADESCSKCGLKPTWNVLGYGPNGDICHDCYKEDTRVRQAVVRRLRLRRLRVA